MMFLLLVTIISMLLALIMSVIAWRVGKEERRRSEARVAALAADIHETTRIERSTPTPVDELELRPTGRATAPPPAAGLSSNRAPARPAFRLFTVAGIGVLVFCSAVAVAVILGSSSATRGIRAAATSDVKPENPSSLELVALAHERDGDRLTVRGAIRNPSGLDINRLTAVVFLIGRDGGVLATGRAAVEPTAGGRGDECTFMVAVPAANDVSRYRVSFRTDNRIVPHVDRREHLDAKWPGTN
jgi:hypothetical protein